jgi:phosphopantothenoylcysteine decarboxylase/phosphopantothenate--cysteine ligase
MKKFDEKMKKESSSDVLNIQLTKTIDIASTLGPKKTENQLLVGFALETNNEFDNAKDKLNRKNLDFIVLNSLNDRGAGFRHDTNKVTILNKKGEEKSFGLKSKIEVAKDIIDVIMES